MFVASPPEGRALFGRPPGVANRGCHPERSEGSGRECRSSGPVLDTGARHSPAEAGGGSARGFSAACRSVAGATLALAALALASAAGAHDQVPAPEQNHPVLLKGGDLYTVAHGVLPGTDLLFEDGRITAIGPGLAPPPGAEVIEVAGRRVYPGLIAPQTTLGLTEIEAVRATRDLIEVGEVTPEAAAHAAFNPDSELIPTVRSHGITTAQVAAQGALLRGRSFTTHLDGWTKEDSAVKLVDGLVLRWPNAAVVEAWWMEEKPEEQRKRMAEERRRLRQAFEAASAYHLAKTADSTRPVDLRWEAMRPVLTGEQPVYVVANDYRQIVEAVAFAREHGLRMVLVGGREAYKLSDLLLENDVPVILDSTTSLPLREDDPYDLPYRLPSLLYEAGVRFCLSHPRSWDARNLPFQAGLAVAFGLPEDLALRAVTLSTAEILGIDADLGSLDVGKEATLFVSDGDVMDTLGQQVTLMFIRGRRVDLDDRQKELYRKYDQKPAGSGPARSLSE